MNNDDDVIRSILDGPTADDPPRESPNVRPDVAPCGCPRILMRVGRGGAEYVTAHDFVRCRRRRRPK